jgi:hypothetical protein
MRIKGEGVISTAEDGKFLLARKWLGKKRKGILEGMNSQAA